MAKPGTFRPGISGNPGGRPKIAREIREAAQKDWQEAYGVLLDVMRNGDKDAARSGAAVKVLQLAGAPMSADGDQAGADVPLPPSAKKPVPTADLLAAATTEGEA